MRKSVHLLLTILLLMTVVSTTVAAKETEQYYTAEQMEEIKNKYENREGMLNALFCQDSALGYWKLINNIKKDKGLSLALDKFSVLIEMYPDEKEYAEMLANLIVMQSGVLAEQIETQSRFDEKKDGTDYALNIMEIASSFIGAGELFEILSTAIGTGEEGIDMIIENNELAKYYEVIFQDYSEADSFLSAVSRYAECEELRKVASSLLEANSDLLMKRLEYLGSVGENMIGYEGEFYLENMSMELLKETDAYLTDETVKWYVDEGIHLKNGILSLKDMTGFAFKATILAGDIGFGTSDVYKRYQEMKTVADIAGALVKANESVSVSAKTQQEEIENIQKKCGYYKALLVTHARGEYLIYQLLMNDAGVISDVRWIREYFKEPQDTTDAWYKSQKETFIRYDDILNDIFNVSNEEIQENESQEWKTAYIDFLNSMNRQYDSFSGKYLEIYKLVNINGDGIPELYINMGSTASGDVLCNYYNGEVITQWMWNYGFSYIEGANLFCDSGGHMDEYYDKVYTIENGRFVMVYDGEYGAKDNSDVQYDEGQPVYDYYANGTQVSSEEEYNMSLSGVYDKSQAANPYSDAEYDTEMGRYVGNGLCDYDEIMDAIANY